MTVRSSARLATVLTTFTLAATVATPGWAHVEVSADKPQAGARKTVRRSMGDHRYASGRM
jgi:hypothetical protein